MICMTTGDLRRQRHATWQREQQRKTAAREAARRAPAFRPDAALRCLLVSDLVAGARELERRVSRMYGWRVETLPGSQWRQSRAHFGQRAVYRPPIVTDALAAVACHEWGHVVLGYACPKGRGHVRSPMGDGCLGCEADAWALVRQWAPLPLDASRVLQHGLGTYRMSLAGAIAPSTTANTAADLASERAARADQLARLEAQTRLAWLAHAEDTLSAYARLYSNPVKARIEPR